MDAKDYLNVNDLRKIWKEEFLPSIKRELKSELEALRTSIKGQMNQKIDIFSFVALTSPNTKKKHPKWDLGKDFSSQAFIER